MVTVVSGQTYDGLDLITRISDLQGVVLQLQAKVAELEVKECQRTNEIEELKGCCNCNCSGTTIPTTTEVPPTKSPPTAPPTKSPDSLTDARDCKELLDLGYTDDGVYVINLNDSPLQVYCDMTKGGWIILQKRYDGSQDFNKTFKEYSEGFGTFSGEFWLGLNHIHGLTDEGNWTLRVDLSSFYNETAWAEYSDFHVGGGTDFVMTFDKSGYQGTAGDGLALSNGMKFSTEDKDQDMFAGGNCAMIYSGGWWYEGCMRASINGMPYGGSWSIHWFAWKGSEVLKSSELKIRLN